MFILITLFNAMVKRVFCKVSEGALRSVVSAASLCHVVKARTHKETACRLIVSAGSLAGIFNPTFISFVPRSSSS